MGSKSKMKKKARGGYGSDDDCSSRSNSFSGGYGSSSIPSSSPSGYKQKGFKKSAKAAPSGTPLAIIVKLQSGKSVMLDVETLTSVSQVKRLIQQREGLPQARQRLILAGRVLQDNKTLESVGVSNEATVHVHMIEDTKINVIVQCPSGRNMMLELGQLSTIRQLKQLVFERESSLPVNRQRLVFHGKQLTDGATLNASSIANEDTVHCSLGPKPEPMRSPVVNQGPVISEQEQEDIMSSFDMGGATGVDVVFSFDTTGSMYSVLDRVRKQLDATCKRLLESIQNLQIGIIAHGDFCDHASSYVLKQKDLTDDVEQLCEFVNNVKPTGGGDAPECYEWALKKARDLSWREGSAKAFVMIGDCEPHQRSYTTENVDWNEELDALVDMGVKVYGVRALNNPNAELFYRELANRSGGKCLRFQNFSLITDMFLAVCFQAADPDTEEKEDPEDVPQTKLQKFQEEVQAEGRMTEELQTVFNDLAQDTQPQTRGDPDALKQPWWHPKHDHGTPLYRYFPEEDRWSRANDHASKQSVPPRTSTRRGSSHRRHRHDDAGGSKDSKKSSGCCVM